MGEEELEELANIDFGIVEETATEVTADGTTVIEHVATIVDRDSGEAIVESIVDTISPDGSEVIKETLSVVDAEGNVEVIGEDEA